MIDDFDGLAYFGNIVALFSLIAQKEILSLAQQGKQMNVSHQWSFV